MALTTTIETPKQKFHRFCPGGFSDPAYLKYERNYKWAGHETWHELLNKGDFDHLLGEEEYAEIARRAMRVESKMKTMLSRFEKSALRDAVKGDEAEKLFAYGLYDLVYGYSDFKDRIEEFARDLASLPERQTSPIKWPIATIFRPQHFLKLTSS